MRARRADTEGGAVLFITVMTLAVLASLALYSLSNARGEVRASGYGMRVAMNDGIQQWAFNSEIARLNIDKGDVAHALDPNGAFTAYNSSLTFNGCIALASVPATANGLSKNCISNPMATYTANAGQLSLWSPSTEPYNASPDFVVELTNADQPPQMVRGMDQHGTNAYALVTISTYGILRLSTAGGIQTSAEIVRLGRGHLVVGPFNNSN